MFSMFSEVSDAAGVVKVLQSEVSEGEVGKFHNDGDKGMKKVEREYVTEKIVVVGEPGNRIALRRTEWHDFNYVEYVRVSCR